MVRERHDPPEESEMDEHEHYRHGLPACVDARTGPRSRSGFSARPGIRRRQAAKLAAKQERRRQRVDRDRQRGFPAEGRHHERGVPVPVAGDHQHRRRGERGQRATDGDVDEQHAKRRVLQAPRDAGGEDALGGRCGAQDRSCAGDDHDRKDEHRLGEIARVEVGDRARRAVRGEHRGDEHERPQPEHHLDFAEEMPQSRMIRLRMRETLE
jgi:hypothetical protein